VGVIAVNGLANAIPIGGQTTGQVSANHESLFTPAGFTFSIWSLIYFGLLLYVIWQALPAQRNSSMLSLVSKWFVLSCGFNAVWMICWHYELIGLSMLMMLGILYCLVSANQVLLKAAPQGIARLVVAVPFAIYVGWITVATIANFSALQVAWGFEASGLTEVEWTQLKLAVAGLIAAIVAVRLNIVSFVLVVAWAANGIAAKQTATPEVAGAAATLAILAVLLAVYAAWRQSRA